MAFISAITDAGIARAITAYGDSVTFDITTARFSSDILTPTVPALEANTGLVNITYTAPNTVVHYHKVDDNTIMIRIVLPPGLTGFSFGSYSLNLDDGTPLVIGTWDTLQIKDTAQARYIEETIDFSNAAAVINLTILTSIDAALPEVPNELSLPTPLEAPYPVYFVHSHTPYNNRPALAMRLLSSWYFIDASLITNVTGTAITSDDRWAPIHRLFGGSLQIAPDPANGNQQTLHFIDNAGNSLARFYRATDGTLRLTDNATAINTITISALGSLTAALDLISGRDITATRNIAATGTISAGGAIASGSTITATDLTGVGGLIINGTAATPASILLHAATGTLPNKRIRAWPSGILDISNSANTGAIFSLTDVGNLSVAGTMTLVDPNGTGGLIINGTGANQASILLHAATGTLPNKRIRAWPNGVLDITNNTNTVALLSLSDVGALTISGSIAAVTTISAGSTVSAVNQVSINGAAAQNAILYLHAGSGATPAKFLRARTDGSFDIVNNADTISILSLSDIGALYAPASITAGTYISAAASLNAGTYISAGSSIGAATSITAGTYIITGTYISVGSYISAIGNISTGGEFIAGLSGTPVGSTSVLRFKNSAGVAMGYIFRDNVSNVITISSSNTPLVGLNIDGIGNCVATSSVGADYMYALAYLPQSDYRLKLDFGLAKSVKSFINSILVHNAAFKPNPRRYHTEISRPMLFAHELQKIAAWAVYGDKDAIDDKGEIISQSIDFMALIPTLIAVNQELIQDNDLLTKRVETLEQALSGKVVM